MASAVLSRLLVLFQFSLDPNRFLPKQISLHLSRKQAKAQIKTISHNFMPRYLDILCWNGWKIPAEY